MGANQPLRTAERMLWYSNLKGNNAVKNPKRYDVGFPNEVLIPETSLPAGLSPNLISSRTRDGMHAPCLDLDDQQVILKPSANEGCYHLLLGVKMPWWKYHLLLRVLRLCNIIEPGFYRASVRRKQSMVRF